MSKNAFGKAYGYYSRNGGYIFCSELYVRFATAFRSRLLARKLRTKGLQIGAGNYIRGLSCMQIGENFHASDGLWLEAVEAQGSQRFQPTIVIGDNVGISRWSHITATHYVEIGSGTLIGSKVMITDHNHGQYSFNPSSPLQAPSLRPLDHDRRVVIGRNVWLGDGVVVTPGANIGDGCVIGANAVVVGTIPAHSIAVGIPAVVVKTFDFDTCTWVNCK